MLEGMKLDGQMKHKNIQKTRVKILFLVLDIHCATNIKASKLIEVLCLRISGSAWDKYYYKTAVTFTVHHFKYSQGKKQFSQWIY